MYLALQSPSVSAREHARSLILSPDGGKAWLRSGWKSEPEADKLGRDIGVAERTGTAQGKGLEGLEGVEGGVEWVEKGRRGMEVVGEGLGML
ncbi:hypothetical protein EHS25_009720 [Saitozyma podzolica]|jgi:hypothetical protein|uniref:Uncharacterized protein n=1 Tax=Saitozyma podzolica TaxID=1890683 RepID=A0A427YK28_9TREE|nr:hypothetical protein EHS25_009720 [Saitozyma podzolica]